MSSTLHERLDAAERQLSRLQVELSAIRAELRPARVAPTAPPQRPEPRREPLAAAPRPAAPPREPGPTPGELLERWDLLGARGLAVAGGVVTLLGIAFFFVLASNRGWIGPGERVLLGACASALVFAGGLVARRRYGPLLASLAAVGAGIAGWYTTLAAATVHYELLSKPVALACAAAIAGVGLVVALAWSSQLLAALALLGAAGAPAALALDEGVTPAGTAFAAVVLAAVVAVGALRRWPLLLGAGVVAVAGQALWTAADAADGDVSAALVAGVVGALVVAAAVAWQRTARSRRLDDVAAALVAAGTTTLLASCWLLYADSRERGLALLAAAAVPTVAAAVAVRMRDLCWLLAGAALTLVAVATADLTSGATLAVVWALQSLAATGAAARTRVARLGLAAMAYAALAAGHAIVVDARLVPDLYPELSAGAMAALSVALAGVAALALAALPFHELPVRRGGGLLGLVDEALGRLAEQWAPVRACIACAGGLLVAGATGLLLVDLMPLDGHVAFAALLAPASVAVVAAATRRGLPVMQAAGLGAAALLFGKAATWDWSELGADRAALDLLAASAALLAGGFAVRALSPSDRRLGWVYGPGAVLAWFGATSAIDQLVPDGRPAGLAMLAVTAAYAGPAAWSFGRERLRDLSTTMWAHALGGLLVAEALLVQHRGIAVAFAATAAGLGVLAVRLHESRFFVAAWVVLGGTSLVTLVSLTPPDRLVEASGHPASSLWVLAACVAAFVGLAWLAEGPERLVLAGIGAAALLYGVSLAILDLAIRISDASLATDFQRGHTAVSGLWGAIGLALLVAGLVRGRQPLRVGGLVLLGVALAKLFLYDLSALSSVTRAVSFLAVGFALLAGGLVVQRWSGRGDPPALAS